MTEAPSVPSNSISPDALLREIDGPAFAEPWMAQAFACAVHLSRQGLSPGTNGWTLSAPRSRRIRNSPARRPTPPTTANGWRRWRPSSGKRAQRRKPKSAERQETWRKAYLNTPHGQPVELHHAAAPPSAAAHHHHATTTASTARRSRSASVRRGGSRYPPDRARTKFACVGWVERTRNPSRGWDGFRKCSTHPTATLVSARRHP